MERYGPTRAAAFPALILLLLLSGPVGAESTAPGFLVAAPDRGALGNRETNAAFADYAPGFNAALAFVDKDRDGEESLWAGIRQLRERGAEEIVLLPLFTSTAHPRHAGMIGTLLAGKKPLSEQVSIYLSPPFGLDPLAEAVSTAARRGELPMTVWLARQSNTRSEITAADLGVVYMPDAAPPERRPAMLEALGTLRTLYRIEPAFGGSDPSVLEQAIRRLEARGAKAVTVLRVSALETDFREPVEFALGIEIPRPHLAAAPGEPPLERPSRLLTRLAVDTVGGIEDSPLLAEALLDRTLTMSREPAGETVFLLAHEAGDGRDSERQNSNLISLAAQIRALAAAKGKSFRRFETGTWRDDSPGTPAEGTAALREKVRTAAREGRAIVVTAGIFPDELAPEFLKGLKHAHDGTGFAPHPAYRRWIEERIQESLAFFEDKRWTGLIPLERLAVR